MTGALLEFILEYPPLSSYMTGMEPTAPKKLPVCVAIAPDQLARLDRIAAEKDRPRSWIVGRAVDEYLGRAEAASQQPGDGGSATAYAVMAR
jgi:hypothetical protein